LKEPTPKKEPHSHKGTHSQEEGQGKKIARAQEGEGGARQSQERAHSQEDCARREGKKGYNKEGPDHKKGTLEGGVRGCYFASNGGAHR
jgi:hypothetical protein